MKRRDFLVAGAALPAAISFNSTFGNTIEGATLMKSGQLPTRNFGKTGVPISIIGLGGIVLMGHEQSEANQIVARSYEKGVSYYDVAPSYGDGEAEEKLGVALEPYRKNIFLACKTEKRTHAEASAALKTSLERLKTDYFDLYQLHAITDLEKDVEVAFGKGGAMEVLIEAKKQGQVRHLGFSAHSVEAALAAMDLYEFDSVLFPFNFACMEKGKFGQQVLERANEKGLSCLALKPMAKQKWPENHPDRETYRKCWYEPLLDPKELDLGLRYTLSLPIVAALPPGVQSLFEKAVDIAMNFKPLSEEELQIARNMAQSLNPLFEYTS